MAHSPNAVSDRSPLRLWPGVLAVGLQWFGRFVVPWFAPDALVFGLLAGMLGGVLVVVWWLFFSRAAWVERIGGVLLMAVAYFGTVSLSHVSMATGAQGALLPIYVVPPLSLAFVAWAVATRNLDTGTRRATMVATILLACGAWTLVRTNGVNGSFNWDFAWRWSPTAEQRLLARAADDTSDALAGGSSARLRDTGDTGAGWPGFRGPRRDGIVRGVRIETDWSAAPPVELWRRPVGPAWSSFAVRGDVLYTQEQRGEEEVVAAYRVTTGEPLWQHADTTRFWEAMAGPGPRGTPALAGDRVYAFGATGIVNALDAADGSVIWSRDAAADAEVATPGWGFASSPLVVGDTVVVAVAGRLAAFDLDTGTPRWFGPPRRESYASPHLLTIEGVPQILLMTGAGVTSVASESGELLWEHDWPGFQSLQPALTDDGAVLIASANDVGGNGVRRLAVTRAAAGWAADEVWTSRGLKPYFNDLVVHDGHAFGFDGRILSCIDLATGERVWKGGRYGNGQLVMLVDQDALLVISEDGDLALVAASTEEFSELARFPALQGKTWNHPVLVGDVLLVRNDQEMAAFRLTLATSTPSQR